MKYAWIEQQSVRWPVTRMCVLLEVSRSGFYAWRGRGPSARVRRDEELVVMLHACHAHHRGKYGRPRLTRDLRAAGFPVNHKRVRRLMLREGLQARRRRRFVRTTDSGHSLPVAPNLLERDFSASAPNQKWVTDITYVGTDEGWLYVALVMDLFSRRLVGWAMSDRIDTQLTMAALALALGMRRPPAGLLHHSDRGSQYCAHDYREVLDAQGITVSMSRRANCYDNSPMESANGTLKVERVYDEHYATRQQAIDDLTQYIGYYNTERRHSALDYDSPVQFERRWAMQQPNTQPDSIASYPPPRALPAYEAPQARARG
ncbi:Mobile element protein [Thauera aromatica K172]|uniref:Mobile element protein n=1 Tax=Thauera aromatica K172 TaxID=44139 RepID=A0A2R4BIM9_THAAR|nr:Mobile element protein [Thauera aromatica K172]AVR87181.1 Mobile element protein [Thauera aromatica K172]AVR89131.1 Mobile element protein [Thauera aromatica K172]